MDPANQERGEVDLLLGDKVLVLVPEYRKIAAMEAAFKKMGEGSLIRVVNFVEKDGLTIQTISVIISATSRDPISEDEVGDLIVKTGGLAAAATAVSLLLRFILSGGKKDEPKNG